MIRLVVDISLSPLWVDVFAGPSDPTSVSRSQQTKTGLGAGEIARIYSGLGEVDHAFEWLDRVDRLHAGWPTSYKVAAMWDPLRSDPRFTALLKKYGLAD